MSEQEAENENKSNSQGATQYHMNEGESAEGSPAPAEPANKAPEPKKEEEGEKPAESEKKEEEAKSEEQTKEEAEKAEKEAAEAAAKEAEEQKKAEIEANEYPVYNDENADAVTEILKANGVTVEEAYELFGKGVEGRDLSAIDQKGLEDKLGKANAKAVMSLASAYYNDHVVKTENIVNKIHEVAGGKETFEKVAEWAKKKESSDPEFASALNDYRSMFEASETQAALATRELMAAFNADPNNKSLQVKMTTGDSTGGGLDAEPLGRAEYLNLMKKAQDSGNTLEMESLRARRVAGRQVGLK